MPIGSVLRVPVMLTLTAAVSLTYHQKNKEDTLLKYQEIMDAKSLPSFFPLNRKWKANFITINKWGVCYGIAGKHQLENTKWYKELVLENNNIDYIPSNIKWKWIFKIRLPLLTKENIWWKIKQTEYTVKEEILSSQYLNLKWYSNSITTWVNWNFPDAAKWENLLIITWMINAFLTEKEKKEKNYKIDIWYVDIEKFRWGFQSFFLDWLLWKQLYTKLYLKGKTWVKWIDVKKERLYKQLLLYSNNPKNFLLWLDVKVVQPKKGGYFYADVMDFAKDNHAISIEEVITKNNKILSIWISDPNRLWLIDHYSFEKIFSMIWSYHFSTLEKASNKRNIDTYAFYKKLIWDIYYNSTPTTLNQLLLQKWPPDSVLRIERWDLTTSIEKTTENILLNINSYWTKTELKIQNKNWPTINWFFGVNWINCKLSFKKYSWKWEKVFHPEKSIEECNSVKWRFDKKVCVTFNEFTKILWEDKADSNKSKPKKADDYLYSELTANLINFIVKKFIIPQKWESLRPFSIDFWNDLEFNVKNKTFKVSILEDINILKLKTQKDKNNFVKFLNDLYEKEYNNKIEEKRKNIYQFVLKKYIKPQVWNSSEPFSIDLIWWDLNFDYKPQKNDWRSWEEKIFWGWISVLENIKYLEFKNDKEKQDYIDFLNFMYQYYWKEINK